MDTVIDATQKAEADLQIFDCDVHPVPKAGLTSLTPYVPRAGQERFARQKAIHDGLNVPIRFKHPNGFRRPRGCPHARRAAARIKP